MISRASKQFLMGDKILEQLVILTIKDQFFLPFRYQAPIENNWYMGRSLADLWDRHYALFANNMHPIQLEVYENYNKFLRAHHDEYEVAQQKEVQERYNEVVDQRSAALNQAEGERLSVDDKTDIYMQVMSEWREKANFSLNTRNKTGEINDYLEVRRPFGAAAQ